MWHAETFMDFDNPGQRKEREGHLKCSKSPVECNSGFADRDLAMHLHVDHFKTYLEARVETIKAQMQAQLEAEMQDRLGTELQRLAALDEHARKVLVARKHIIDKILTLSCPQGTGFLNEGYEHSLIKGIRRGHERSRACQREEESLYSMIRMMQ